MTTYRLPKDIGYEEFKAACENSESMIEVTRKLRLKPHKTYIDVLKELSYKHNVALPVWDNRKATQQAIKASTRWTPATVFVYGERKSGSLLRKMLIQSGVPYVCSNSKCPLHEKGPFWCDEPITLQVDHIDGDNLNNEQNNLRFLCPNCHAQTDTFGSKSARARKVVCECGRLRGKDLESCPHGDRLKSTTKLPCVDCGEPRSQEAFRCNLCENKRRRDEGLAALPARFPPLEEMTANIEAKGWLAYSRELGISDNGLRKVFKRLGVKELPSRKRG